MSFDPPGEYGQEDVETPPRDVSRGTRQPESIASIQRLNGTKNGFQLVYYGVVLVLIALVLSIFAFIIFRALNSNPAGGAPASVTFVVVAACSGVAAIGSLTIFVGQCFCLGAPKASKAKGPIIWAVSLQMLALLGGLGIAVAAIVMAEVDPEAVAPLYWRAEICIAALAICSCFCQLLFVKRVARFIERTHQTKIAGIALAVFGALFALCVLLIGNAFAVAAVRAGAGREAAALLGLLSLGVVLSISVLGVVGLCLYTALLKSMVKAIAEEMRLGNAV